MPARRHAKRSQDVTSREDSGLSGGKNSSALFVPLSSLDGNSSNDSLTTTDDSSSDLPAFLAPPYWFIYAGIAGFILLLLLLIMLVLLIRLWRRHQLNKTLKMNYMNRTLSKKKLGLVDYILHYDYTAGKIRFEVLQIHDIKFIGKKQPDVKEIATYFRVYLVPNMNKYHESKRVMKTFSPEFGESFTFKCVIDDLDSSKILVRLYQHHKCLRDMPIGDALIQLSKTDLKVGFSTEPMYSYNPALDDPLGEICISLRYNPARSRLNVTIIECRRLKALDWGGLSDPYVKVTISFMDKVLLKEKTEVKKSTINPYFNQTFSVKVAPNKIQALDMRILVKDHDLFGPNDTIGGVRFGIEPDSEVAERQWYNMIENIKRPQTEWHHLLSVE